MTAAAMGDDLIDVRTFLKPTGLEQYRECFMTNLWGGDGRGLSRRKLAQVQMHHLPDMNITRHDHQKIIMARLKELDRIPAVGDEMTPESDVPATGYHSSHVALLARANSSVTSQTGSSRAPGKGADGGRQTLLRRSSSNDSANGAGRRSRKGSSIDATQTWAAIQTARQQLDKDNKTKRLDQMRSRQSTLIRIDLTKAASRRGTFINPATSTPRNATGTEPSVSTAESRAQQAAGHRLSVRAISMPVDAAAEARQRAQEYGNKALKSNTLENQLKELKRTLLQQLCDTMSCEKATIMFLDQHNEVLFFFDGDTCIRFPMSKGVAGYCATTGERLLVNDPYSDPRFNQAIDKQTGFVTRNILCEPIRSRMGGALLAVLQMVNKRGGEGFTEQDSEVM
eukprot:TRINITY_DN25049_c0_g1_i1.p1 TRINITY_DN25049_c0_g1~~TRINITY_DN25049_c0_g1_i1.p1  ORF type:complete len:409 (+),score=85.10 TRINITY_DN25049_c0_g1_i1:37-1227(+)